MKILAEESQIQVTHCELQKKLLQEKTDFTQKGAKFQVPIIFEHDQNVS